MPASSRVLAAILGASLFALPAAAQERPRRDDPMTPSAPHERMTFFEGTWTIDTANFMAGSARPPLSHEETCAWLAGGRRHMVCRSWRQAAKDGPRTESLYILSWRQSDSTYVGYFAFQGGGANLVYHGRVEGDRWVMDMKEAPNLPPGLRLRTTITRVAAGLRYVEEASRDGGPWRVTEDYVQRRVR